MYLVWSIALLILTIFSVICYLKAAKKTNNETITRGKKFSFILGVILFFVVQSGPVLNWGDSFFLVHMAQQTVTYFIVPILILTGLTDELLKPFYRRPMVDKILKIFTKPMVSLFLFTLLFSIYYLPFVFDTIMSYFLFRIIAMILLLPFAFFEWWLIVSPTKSQSSLNPFQKIAYLVGLGLLFTPLGVYIIFSGEALYESYARWDQQAGGTAWKITTVLIYIIMMGHSLSEAAKLEREKTEESADYISNN